jgi:hypothetical protein
MEIQDTKAPTLIYDYAGLETFFSDISSPQETALHIDQLLHCLVYYQYKEGIEGFYGIYSEIFELKCVLQNMVKTI